MGDITNSTYRSKNIVIENNKQLYAKKFDHLGEIDKIFEDTIYPNSLKKSQITWLIQYRLKDLNL